MYFLLSFASFVPSVFPFLLFSNNTSLFESSIHSDVRNQPLEHTVVLGGWGIGPERDLNPETQTVRGRLKSRHLFLWYSFLYIIINLFL